MASRVAVYTIPGHLRSRLISAAVAEGIRVVGDHVIEASSEKFDGPIADVAVFYGFTDEMRAIFASYRAADLPVVYIDLGYWDRHHGGRFNGYHKFSVNGRHPTAYFQRKAHDRRRFAKLGVTVQPWQSGRHIILAGASEKAARVDGFGPEEWERWAISVLKQHTDREIVYRPKPSWRDATPLPGTTFAPSQDDLSVALRDCHAVVTHHSNAGVDALVAGVPVFSIEGVATRLGCSSLELIETPLKPDGRVQWACDVSYCQWLVSEMREGLPWRHLKDEGLVP